MEHARNDDPQTSHDAVPAAARREVIQRTMLLQHGESLRHHSQLRPYQGYTDYEIMEACGFDLADDGHRRRHGDLRALGLIAFEDDPDTGKPRKRRSEHSGVSRAISYLTNEGVRRLIEWGF